MIENDTYDFIIRQVNGCGFLPIVKDWDDDGKELYRGEYQDTAAEALAKAIAFVYGGVDVALDDLTTAVEGGSEEKSMIELMDEMKAMADNLVAGSKRMAKERE